MKESKLEERAKILLPKLTSNDVAQESFEAIKNNKKTKTVNLFRPELTAKLTKRLHLDPLAWLSQRDIFNEKLKMALQEVVAALNNPTFKENDIYDNNCSDEELIRSMIMLFLLMMMLFLLIIMSFLLIIMLFLEMMIFFPLVMMLSLL